MKRIILLALCGITCSNLIAQDKVEETKYTISGGLLGAANMSKFRIPDENNTTNPSYDRKTGWAAGAWVNFPITGFFSIEPQVLYSTHNYHTNSTTTELLNEGDIHYISVPIVLKFNAGKVIAFTAGPQIDFLSGIDDDRNVANRDDFNRTTFSLFGGVELFPRARVSVFGRYVHGLSNMDNRTDHSATTQYKNSNIQLGLKLRLFGKKSTSYKASDVAIITPPRLDSDGDGIYDDEDKCPNQAGLAKYDGCPIPDSDGDGVNDEMDKCPNEAGLAKYEGCPIPDSDGDGINDELDKCPNQAGVAKYEGCPVPDKDGDGINDDDDKCPDIAGISANNGCPDVPANVSKTLAVQAQKIYFGNTNATLTSKSNASLEQVVNVMNDNPGLHIRVEGHTDNAGDADASMKLSEDRANAVKDYLVSKGISGDRIVAEGFGGTQPIGDNATSSGRMKNRRIELRVAY